MTHNSSHSKPSSGYVLVAPRGELDLSERNRLGDLLDSALAESSNLIVDLDAVTFLDSTALSVLLRAHREAEQQGGRVTLARPSDAARKILRITQLDRVMAVHDTVESAIEPTPEQTEDR